VKDRDKTHRITGVILIREPGLLPFAIVCRSQSRASLDMSYFASVQLQSSATHLEEQIGRRVTE
jgi:hypothetical protein